jgi:hypothetical protein
MQYQMPWASCRAMLTALIEETSDG